MILSSDVALKEWSATIAALEAGRQILLLRKGGLLDPGGAFEMEYSAFWLAPRRFHQDETLVKADAASFLQPPPAERGVLSLRNFAVVEKTWAVRSEKSEKLARLDHIWSTRWLDTRFDYRPEKPLLVAALRVFVLLTPRLVAMQPEYSGCKSWIELDAALATGKARPALGEDEFQRHLVAAARVLEG